MLGEFFLLIIYNLINLILVNFGIHAFTAYWIDFRNSFWPLLWLNEIYTDSGNVIG